MTELEIADTIFKQIDQEAVKELIFPTTLEEIGLQLSEDKTTNCWIDNFENLNQQYDFISWMGDETWEEDISADLEGNLMLVINQDIIYDGNIDLTQLLQNVNSDDCILMLGNIKITGTLIINETNLYIAGSIQAAKVIISPNGGTVFNNTITATDYIEFQSSDAYIFINDMLTAPLIIDSSAITLFLNDGVDKNSVVIPQNFHEVFEFRQKEYGFTCIKKHMLKEAYIDMNYGNGRFEKRYENKHDEENNIISDYVPVKLDRLVYAIKNNLPYLKEHTDLTINP